VCFAIVGGHFLANGRFVEVSAAYRPGERPKCFDNVEAVPRTLAGNRTGPGIMAYTNAKTEVIDDAMVAIEPVDGLRQLLTHFCERPVDQRLAPGGGNSVISARNAGSSRIGSRSGSVSRPTTSA
jgi:hypothetical protein